MNPRTLNANLSAVRYRALIGTGGIGSGIFFALDGNHTLGREESRSGHFLDRRDYCKLHIVSHYVRRLLGSDFPVIPLGMVGADDVGERLLGEMMEVGLDIRYVGRAEGRGTLYALCLIYPDGSGGNVTENDSACAAVDAGWINRAENEFARFAGAGIALALPEVPLGARQKLLALGKAHGFLRVASFTTAELVELAGRLDEIDLLALNLDEAAALAGVSRRQRTRTRCAGGAGKAQPGHVAYRDRGRAGELVLGWDGVDAFARPAGACRGHGRRWGCPPGRDHRRAGGRAGATRGAPARGTDRRGRGAVAAHDQLRVGSGGAAGVRPDGGGSVG